MSETPRRDNRPPEILPHIGKIGAAGRWAGSTRQQRQAEMRAGPLAAYADRWERLAREQFPDLDDNDIAREAERIKSAHYSRMAIKSAMARRRGSG